MSPTGSVEFRAVRNLSRLGHEVFPGSVLAQEGEEATTVARRLL